MGRVDQGVLHVLAAAPPLRPAALLHRLRRRRATGARPAARRRPVRAASTSSSREPDRWDGFVGNVGGGREVSLSLRETTDVCRELTGNEVRDRARRRRSARATCRSTSPTARGSSARTGVAPAARRAARYSRDIHAWITDQRGRRRGVAGVRAMKLSIVMPAHNEAGLDRADDPDRDRDPRARRGSSTRSSSSTTRASDRTVAIVDAIAAEHPQVRCLRSHYPRGLRLRDPLRARRASRATRWR